MVVDGSFKQTFKTNVFIHHFINFYKYATAIGLNSEEIGKHWQGTSKINPVINKYHGKEVNHPTGNDYQIKFEKNVIIIGLNLSYVKQKKLSRVIDDLIDDMINKITSLLNQTIIASDNA